MNLRTLKKRSKLAVPFLVGHYGYRAADFFPAEKGDNHHGMVIRCRHKPERHGLQGCGCAWHPLKGTPMYGEVSGHEEPEWDERPALAELRDSVRWKGRPEGIADADWARCMRVAGTHPFTIAEMNEWWGDPDGDEETAYITCPICKGTGMEPDELWPCGECKGTGEVCSACRQPPAHAEDGVVVGGCWCQY